MSVAAPRRALDVRWIGMAAFLLVAGVAWQTSTALGWWPPATVPSPSAVWAVAGDVLGSGAYWTAVRTTLGEIGITLVGALVLGGALGAAFWRVPYLGRVCEPFLVAFYAVPVIVFYPVTVVVIGFGSRSVILLALVAATIPMALNTWIALRTVPAVLWKLAASLECSPAQTAVRVAIPAAAPGVMAGVRLATIYAVLAATSMEFLLAKDGLGYQIRYSYELLDQPTMVVYVLTVFVLGAALALGTGALEARIGRRHRS